MRLFKDQSVVLKNTWVRLTEDEDTDNKDDSGEQTIEHVDRLINIVHASSHRLAATSNLRDRKDHLVETDIAIAILVESREGFLSFDFPARAKNFDNVIVKEGVSAFDDERHPKTLGKSLRGTRFLERLDNHVVGRIRVEDLLASDLGSNVAKSRGNLISDTSYIMQETHGGRRSGPCVTLLGTGNVQPQRVVDNVIFFLKLRAVGWEERPGSIEEQTKKEYLALVLLDLRVELLAVVVDADELDKELFNEQDACRDDSCGQELTDDLLPFLDGICGGGVVG